jgi:hypothetical protein
VTLTGYRAPLWAPHKKLCRNAGLFLFLEGERANVRLLQVIESRYGHRIRRLDSEVLSAELGGCEAEKNRSLAASVLKEGESCLGLKTIHPVRILLRYTPRVVHYLHFSVQAHSPPGRSRRWHRGCPGWLSILFRGQYVR